VVSTDCPTGPAEVLLGGRFGPLVPVGDAEALANAILNVLDQPLPRDDLRQRAADFSVERSVAGYLELAFGCRLGFGIPTGESSARPYH
jgi:glycosyltransferase involved in cell wall biosynthesis